MSADITLPAGAPEEVVTNALVRDIDLSAFGGKGTMALITLDNGHDHNRPNTFGPQSVKALDAAITDALGRKPAAIAITGKPFIFAAGADLSALSFLNDRSQALAIGKLGHDVFRRLGESSIPTFAFINGLALGGGLEVGLHCHYRTVSSTAFTALPEVFLGLVPGWGGATILPKLIGPERAVQVIMLNALNNNTMMKAKDALKLGVVDAMYEPADFLERSIGFAVGVLNGTTKIERADYSNDPAWESALATGKAAALKKYGGATIASPMKALELIAAAKSNTLGQGFDAEDQVLSDLTMSDPLRSSLYAFNLIQKKRKKVEGAPKPALARKVTKVGVVGAGLMASQLALLMVRNLKCPVVMTDIDQARADKGVAWVKNELAKLVEKKRMSAESAGRLSLLISGSADQSVFAGCDFVIEAIFEELSLKQELFKKLETILSPECVLATNTSSLSVERMTEGLKNPERVVGFHFFNPVAVMPLVEVVRAPKSSDEAVATAMNVAKNLKKTAVITADAAGFVVNRLLGYLLGEAMRAVDEGASFEQVADAIAPLGLPMNPFDLLELVGLKVGAHVLDSMHAFNSDRFYASENLHKLAEYGKLTERDAKGNIKGYDKKAIEIVGNASGKGRSAAEIFDAVNVGLAKEVHLMLQEGVVATAQDIDLSMIMGAAWPFHLGGITPYLDRSGASKQAFGGSFHDPMIIGVRD